MHRYASTWIHTSMPHIPRNFRKIHRGSVFVSILLLCATICTVTIRRVDTACESDLAYVVHVVASFLLLKLRFSNAATATINVIISHYMMSLLLLLT